jgi:arabinose-5-phosphate isomerase
MGDALAVCLLDCHGFSVSDFAKFHPGGSIGKKLYLKVADLCANNEVPQVKTDDNLKYVIIEISSKRLGATAVLDNDKLAGIITDGDIRRMLEKNIILENVIAKDIMSSGPKTVDKETLVVDALATMRKNNITQLLVLDNDKYFGVIHLHDIIKEGLL